MAVSFTALSARYLRDTYVPRIAAAVERLPPGALWRRPHPDTTSCGNLLVHLEGNVRQWILSGLGGTADRRDRAAEFALRDGAGPDELLAALAATVDEAAALIEGLDERDLDAEREIQGFSVCVREAVYHVVEHFSWHTGQIAWIAKLHAGEGHGLAFYDEHAVNRARNREGA